MSSGYLNGNDIDGRWRAKYYWEKSVSDTQVTCKSEIGMESINYGIDVNYVDASVTLDGETSSVSNQAFYSDYATTTSKWYTSKTKTFNRVLNDYTVYASATVYNHSSYLDGTSTVNDSFVIPARVRNAHGNPNVKANKTKAYYSEKITLTFSKSATQGNANFDHFEVWQGSKKLYSGSNTSYVVTPSDVTGAKGGTVTYTIKEVHEWYGTYPETSVTIKIEVQSGVVTVYDSNKKKHVGLVTAYDSKGKGHYVLITAYDSSGKAHNVV